MNYLQRAETAEKNGIIKNTVWQAIQNIDEPNEKALSEIQFVAACVHSKQTQGFLGINRTNLFEIIPEEDLPELLDVIDKFIEQEVKDNSISGHKLILRLLPIIYTIDEQEHYTFEDVNDLKNDDNSTHNTGYMTMMAYFNLYFKKLNFNGSLSVLKDNNYSTALKSKDFFEAYTLKKYKLIERDTKGNEKSIVDELASKMWFKNTMLYNDMRFLPYNDLYPIEQKDDIINNFKPFLEPNYDNIEKAEPIIDFIKTVICNNNQKHYDYYIQWLAQMYCNPASKEGVGISIVLRSGTGTGKSTMGYILEDLLGGRDQCYTTSRIEDITGQFNGKTYQKICVIGEEAIWGGDKKEIGTLKDLITSHKMNVRFKFKETMEVDNYIRLMFFTNEDWIPGSKDERRFICFDVSSIHKQDEAYFINLKQCVKKYNNGFAAYLRQQYNPSFDFQANFILTEGVKESIEMSADTVYNFVEELLEKIGMNKIDDMTCSDVYVMYADSKTSRFKVERNAMIRQIKKILPDVQVTRKGKAQIKVMSFYDFDKMMNDYTNYLYK